MLPPHVIEQIRQREQARRERERPQPQLELPIPSPPPSERGKTERNSERGIAIISLFD
jgi:hypothetical protein